MKNMVCNPRPLTDLWRAGEIGDPFIMRFDGRFYLYCSSHAMGPGLKCWTSDDMIDFTYYGYVCEDERIWGAYAPEVMYNDGMFYMVTSPVGSGHYMLRSPSPLGPFTVISENYGLTIDGSQFLDDDGKGYFLRAGTEGIIVHDMPSADKINPRGKVIPASFLGHWTEGPMIIKRNGRYYLSLTGNHVLSKGYRVTYCVSSDAPDHGYRCLNEPTLLLETRDEFHGLGHSATCVGPDMDTMYIVYHKNILDERNRPDHRSMNLDRLYFNGDRMYCNATWWPQEAPVQPSCATRDGKGMVKTSNGLALPEKTGDTFTAEINITLTQAAGQVFFGDSAYLAIEKNSKWTLAVCNETFEGVFNTAVNANALMTVKVSLHQGHLELFVNGMMIHSMQSNLKGGAIGISDGCAPSFVGFSGVAQGSDEKEAAKPIPGVFDGVHCAENHPLTQGEKGCMAVSLPSGGTLTYPVNVLADGTYQLVVTMQAQNAPLELVLSCNGKQVPLSALSPSMPDKHGMEKRWLGMVTLEAGMQTLTISNAGPACAIDRLYLLEAHAFIPAKVIDNGADVSKGALRVIGHKQQKSMLHKYSGYTCAEGYGEGYLGGMWRDYQVNAVVNIDPYSPDASASIYLRSRLESWHPHQIASSRMAYCIRILPDRVVLYRQEYHDEKRLAMAALDIAYPAKLSLVCKVKGDTIVVSLKTDAGLQVLIHATDALALPTGRMGIDARGDGIGFEAVTVEMA